MPLHTTEDVILIAVLTDMTVQRQPTRLCTFRRAQGLSSKAQGTRLLAEDLACLHDVLEGHKILDAPVQSDLIASRSGVWL